MIKKWTKKEKSYIRGVITYTFILLEERLKNSEILASIIKDLDFDLSKPLWRELVNSQGKLVYKPEVAPNLAIRLLLFFNANKYEIDANLKPGEIEYLNNLPKHELLSSTELEFLKTLTGSIETKEKV